MGYITKGVGIWLFLSSVIVIIDAFYVLNRPDTLPGGKYADYFSLYQHYVRYDSLYGPNHNLFVPVIAYLNLAEVVVTLLGGVFCLFGSRKNQLRGAILMILASAFVLWKTVIYIIYDIEFMSEAARTFQLDAILLYYIPNGFWIVCPLWSIISISSRIGREALGTSTKSKHE